MDFPVNFDLTLLLNKKMFQRLCLAKRLALFFGYFVQFTVNEMQTCSRIEIGKITATVRGGIPFEEAKTEMGVPHSFETRKEFMKDLKASFEKGERFYVVLFHAILIARCYLNLNFSSTHGSSCGV